MRLLDFADGFTSANAPTVGSLFVTTSTSSSPTSVTAAGGVAPNGYSWEVMYVKSNSGAVDITANPQIAAGTAQSQLLVLVGCSDTDTLQLDDATGLAINGSCILVKDSMIALLWDNTASKWKELCRNDV